MTRVGSGRSKARTRVWKANSTTRTWDTDRLQQHVTSMNLPGQPGRFFRGRSRPPSAISPDANEGKGEAPVRRGNLRPGDIWVGSGVGSGSGNRQVPGEPAE